MKKLISILIAAIICFGCVLPAFADMDAPFFKEYDAYVCNPDGVTYTESWSNKTTYIPYNEKVTVTGEYDDGCNCKYGDNYVIIKPEDLSKVKSSVDMSEAVKLDHPMTYIVYAEKGAKFRKGPAESYDEVGTIPCNTEITVQYGTQKDTYYLPWAYCTYEGVSGWIYVYQVEDCDFVIKLTELQGKSGKITTITDGLRLSDKPSWVSESPEDESEAKYISDPIPAGTEFSYTIYRFYVHCFFAYVEYNGVKGWLRAGDTENGYYTSEVSADYMENLLIYGGSADIYSKPFGEGEKLGTIPENSGIISYQNAAKAVSKIDGSEISDSHPNFTSIAIDIMTYCVMFNGVKGWITIKYDYSSFRVANTGKIGFIKFHINARARTQRGYKGDTITISPDTECIWLGRDWEGCDETMILLDGKTLYVPESFKYESTREDLKKEDIETKLFGKPLEIDFTMVSFKLADSEENEKSETEDGNKEKGIRNTIILIIAIAVIFVIVSLVTIILIVKQNKKKSSDYI